MAARLNIYVPDHLADEVRDAELNVSRIAQDALRLELRGRAAPADVRAVADRLRQTSDPLHESRLIRFRHLGAEWARERASLDEFRDVVFESDSWTHWDPGSDHSLRPFLEARGEWHGEVSIPLRHTPLVDEFIGGATEIWESVAPLLRDDYTDDADQDA